jgi:perosamine synthetase
VTGSSDWIPFHRPSLGEDERAALIEVIDSGWLTTGARSAAFETAFATFVGTKNAVGLNSGTAALHLAMEGIGVSGGDEVVVPTYTFAASAEVAMYLGARPVLVDVDPSTANVDAGALAAAIGPATRAVEIVHIGGLPADLEGVLRAIDGIPSIEDAAHAFPCRLGSAGGRLAGTIGRAGAFSFYATKTITTGEGGMLVTDDDELADRARTMRQHGIGRDAWKRYTSSGQWYYEIDAAGFKDNPTDLASALGLVQLDRADELHAARVAIAERYLSAFAEAQTDGRLILPAPGAFGEHAWHLFMIRLGEAARPKDRVDRGLAGVSGLPQSLQLLASKRARAIEAMRAMGIGTSVHFIPLHLHPLYARMGYRPGQFPNAEAFYAGEVSLPIWPGMTASQVDRVVEAVLAAIEGS